MRSLAAAALQIQLRLGREWLGMALNVYTGLADLSDDPRVCLWIENSGASTAIVARSVDAVSGITR
jgi:hypothetical protein